MSFDKSIYDSAAGGILTIVVGNLKALKLNRLELVVKELIDVKNMILLSFIGHYYDEDGPYKTTYHTTYDFKRGDE
jgi:hypothetical protein